MNDSTSGMQEMINDRSTVCRGGDRPASGPAAGRGAGLTAPCGSNLTPGDGMFAMPETEIRPRRNPPETTRQSMS